MNRITPFLLAALACIALSSCATYVTPGGQADLSTFTNPDIKKAFTAKAAATYPANIAIVRVQASGYYSQSTRSAGSGAYSVVTHREMETQEDAARIADLPGVADVVALNRLLLPDTFSSDLDVRTAAAKLQADLILVYTMSTSFDDGKILPPLTTLTLGFAPNKTYKVQATASAIMMDTRTGFIYGALEEVSDRSGITMAMGSNELIDRERKRVEREAFDKLLESFVPFWKTVYAKYKRN